ncbi:MAG: tRNA (adenosine(37)-N6)-dimethylallyltransferase MiaA, partial [Pseudomonadota bacterium]
HLIDILEPNEIFTAFDFVKKADEAISDIVSRGKLPLIVGGTYFYLKGLQKGMYAIPPVDPLIVEMVEKEFEDSDNSLELMHQALQTADPASAKAIHPHDRYRIVRALAIFRSTGKKPSELSLAHPTPKKSRRLWVKYAILLSRHDLTHLITQRTDLMLSQGLIEEVKLLRKSYPNAKALSSIGYAECVKFLNQEIDQKQLRNEIIDKTRQLAKRQMTWLRSDPEVRFIDHRDTDRVILEVSNLMTALKNKEASV